MRLSTGRILTKKFLAVGNRASKRKSAKKSSMDIVLYGQCQITHINIEYGITEELHLKHNLYLFFNLDIVPSDFFLFG
jgi:hypothetical protein